MEYSMTFLARGVCGSLPIVTMSGPDWTIISTSNRILPRSMSRFFRTLAATPAPSLTRPRRMCSVPMYSWLKRWASWLANRITVRARSPKQWDMCVSVGPVHLFAAAPISGTAYRISHGWSSFGPARGSFVKSRAWHVPPAVGMYASARPRPFRRPYNDGVAPLHLGFAMSIEPLRDRAAAYFRDLQ